jgi:hypothetical protein
MRPLRHLHEHISRRRGLRLLAAGAVVCFSLLGSATAFASVNKAEFAKFVNCPIAAGKACLYGEVLSGEFKMGSKAVPLTNPTILQGGMAYLGTTTLPIIPPLYGAEELSKASQPIPGGLTGITEIIGGPVSATAELAGTVNVTAVFLGFGHGTAVELPIKVHLENEILGPNCYIGSEAEPVVLKLTDGTTEPPAGTEPMTGKIGTNEGRDKGRILDFVNNTLVDNTFAVPAATGCGTGLLAPVINAAVNLDAGLPSAPGKSYAIMNGNQFTSFSEWVGKYDKKLIKEKTNPKKK